MSCIGSVSKHFLKNELKSLNHFVNDFLFNHSSVEKENIIKMFGEIEKNVCHITNYHTKCL